MKYFCNVFVENLDFIIKYLWGDILERKTAGRFFAKVTPSSNQVFPRSSIVYLRDIIKQVNTAPSVTLRTNYMFVNSAEYIPFRW